MASVEYRILAYARSEDAVQADDCLVVLSLADVAGPPLRAFLCADLDRLLVGEDEMTVEYVQLVLYDIRQFVVKERSSDCEAFFEAISYLSVGPLRTSASGVFDFQDAGDLTPLLTDNPTELNEVPTEVFGSLIKSIFLLDDQLQAARS